MKTLLSTAFAAAFVFSSSLLADETQPIELSAAQLDQVTAGVGVGPTPGAGLNGWGVPGTPSAGHGLINAGFAPPGAQMSPGGSGLNVTVPGDKG